MNIHNEHDESSYIDTAINSCDDKADSGYDSLQSETTQQDALCLMTLPAAHVTCSANHSTPSLIGGVSEVHMASTTKCRQESEVNRSPQVHTVDCPRPPMKIDITASHLSLRPPHASFISPVDYTFTYQQLLRDLHSVTVSTSTT